MSNEKKPNENNVNDHFICPITLEIYKDPVFIPECGHTFERQNLINLQNKKCPICNNVFNGNPNNFQINWSLASIMNINVKKPEAKPEDELLNYDAKSAREDRQKFINEIKLTTMIQIVKQVKQYALSGRTCMDYDLSGVDTNIIGIIKQELTKKGFSLTDVHMKFNWVRISW